MSISGMIGLMDDAGQFVQRIIGRRSTTTAAEFTNPADLIAGLRNPATEASAVARMRKLHYGSFYTQTSRIPGISNLAENELLKKGKGLSGAAFGRPIKGLGVGMSHLKGAAIFAPLSSFAYSAMAPKGHKVSGMVEGTARALAFGVGDLVGTALGGPLAGFALGSLTEQVGKYVGDMSQIFTDFNRNIKHVNMGGNFQDSQVAYTMRQRAAQELGSSVMNARAWLGKEALLLHQ